MIIKGLLSLIFSLLSLLLTPIPNLPEFPPEVESIISQVSSYISAGMGIINAYTYGNVIGIMITLTLALWAFYELYIFVMWLLKKVPLAGVE